MIATWMISAMWFSALLGGTALFAEAALRAARRATRWPWVVALGAGTTWPIVAPLFRRVMPHTGALHTVAATLPAMSVVSDRLPTMPVAFRIDATLLALWAAASVIALIRVAHALIIIARIRRASEARIVDGVPVLVTGTIGPAVIGLRHPHVLLPSALLELDEPLRRLVLRHELEHCRTHDQVTVIASAIALALVPWNLPLWWIARRCRLALEVDCDARVLAGQSNAQQYGKLLLLISQRARMPMLAPMLAASSSHLERRVTAMMSVSPKHRRLRMAVALAATVIAGIAACTSRIPDGITGARPRATPQTAEMIGSIQSPTMINPEQSYFEFQVSRQVQGVPGTGTMRYPDQLRTANVQGEVLVQFIVDANGRFEPGSFRVLKSSHELFTQAVRTAIGSMTFTPAELRGVKVKQLVQWPFNFTLSSSGSPAPSATSASTDPVDSPQPYFEFQVEKQARQIPGSGNLRYPDVLRAANVQGVVLAQFPFVSDSFNQWFSFKALKSSHELFTQAVLAALPDMKFSPAEVGGSRVRQLIQQPFTFSLASY